MRVFSNSFMEGRNRFCKILNSFWVKIVHGLKSRWGVIAFIAKDFAHMGPVFLFDMGVVVFFVRASSSELDLVLIAESLEVIVDKL